MSEKYSELRASAFTLVDDEGRPRGTLSCRSGNAGLSLADGAGKVRMTADVGADGVARFMLVGDGGNARIGMDLYPEGPSFFMRDADGNIIIGVDLQEVSADAVISMYDSSKHLRLALRTNAKAPGSVIEVRDAEGNLRIKISASDALPGITILDRQRVQTHIDDDAISLFGMNNARFIAPDGDPSEDAINKNKETSARPPRRKVAKKTPTNTGSPSSKETS